MVRALFLIQDTYVLVNTAVDPAPSVRGRVLRIRHVRAGIEAPSGVLFGSYFLPIAEERPDGVGPARVPGVVLLWKSVPTF